MIRKQEVRNQSPINIQKPHPRKSLTPKRRQVEYDDESENTPDIDYQKKSCGDLDKHNVTIRVAAEVEITN